MNELSLVFQSIDPSSISPLIAMLWALAQISLIAIIATIFPFYKLCNPSKKAAKETEQKETVPTEKTKIVKFFSKFTHLWFKLINALLGISAALLGLAGIIASVSILNSDFPWKNSSSTLLYTIILVGASATLLGYGLLKHSVIAWKAYRAAIIAGIFSMIFWWPDMLINHGLTTILASLAFVAGEILLLGQAAIILITRDPKYEALFVH